MREGAVSRSPRATSAAPDVIAPAAKHATPHKRGAKADSLDLFQVLRERIANRGAVVTRLTPRQVFDLYDTREVLEGLAVRLATENSAPGAWDDLAALFGEPAEEAERLKRASIRSARECFRRYQKFVL